MCMQALITTDVIVQNSTESDRPLSVQHLDTQPVVELRLKPSRRTSLPWAGWSDKDAPLWSPSPSGVERTAAR